MNNTTFKHSKFKIKILANILFSILTPIYAHANDITASVTDGTNLPISGKYSTSKKATHALTASGTNSTLTSNGEVSVTTGGSAAYSAYIYNGGNLNLTDSSINTSGGAANGVVLSNGSAKITGGSIATSGSSSTAVRINNHSHLDINGTTISTKQYSSSAIDASGGSQVTLNNSNISIAGGGLPGINLKDQGTTLNGANNHISLDAYSDGIDLNSGSSADLQDTTINMNGGLSAIRSNANTSLTMKNLTVNGSTTHALNIADSALIDNGSINLTQGSVAIAMGSTDKYANLVLNNVNATSQSRAGAMIDANNYSKITLNGGSYLLKGDNDTGAYIADNTATLEANNTSITTEGNASAAIENHGTTNIKGSSILTKGNNAYALYSEGALNANDTNVETNGSSSAAITAARGGIINVKNSTIKTTGNLGHMLLNFGSSTINADGISAESSGKNAYGVYALGGSTTNILNSTLSMTGEGGGGIYAQGTATKETTITLDNSTLLPTSGPGINAAGAKLNVNLKNGSTLRGGNNVLATVDSASNSDSLVNITAADQSTLEGDITATDNNQINLSLSNKSIWSGGAHNTNDIEISPDSQWVLTSDSDTNTLNMNGILDMSQNNSGYNTLTVKNSLQGNGEFAMRAAMAEQQGDLLVTQHSTDGQFRLDIKNDGGQQTNGSEQLTMVKTAESGGSFALSHEVEQGGYLYGLRQAANPNNWELYSLGEKPTTEDPVEPGTPEQPSTPSKPPAGHGALTSTAKAAASFANTTYLMNYAETQTLMQRMGELRGNDKSIGLWGRGFVGRFDNFSNGKLSGFTMNYHGFQFGADKKLTLQDGVMYLGTFMGLGNSSQAYQDGDGSLKSTSVGLYSTYLTPTGFYVDTVLKYSNMRNRFSVLDTADQLVRGKDSVNGFAASVESGKRFYFNEKPTGFYLEPQAQLSLSYQSSESIHASNNLKINIDSYNSTLGRASLVAGYNISDGSMPTNIYLKSGYIREFSGKIDYRLNGSSEQYSNKGGGWNNAIGISTEIKKQHSLYVDLDSTSGGKFDQRQFNAGYRYSF
ncbi:autotransporter outer membrane beta-barrel domain-containing protein [Rouxiella sp. Mn2063]|uniref:autotransporter outer membrane beta-barrel domain-containing protein n=1 Tax=Rouxiella sp. Mn2063 TaxID=3395262 RepID=UPI003BF5E8B0